MTPPQVLLPINFPIFINLKIQEDLDDLSADERMAMPSLVKNYPAMKALFTS